MLIKQMLTLKVPQANTFPPSSRTAVCESPADICFTVVGSSTSPAVNSASSLSEVFLPRAPSSLHPKVKTYKELLDKKSKPYSKLTHFSVLR